MSSLSVPTGTVTFLFTDIEGSTKLWETYPEAMRIALARHDIILRECVENADSYIFKTIGDAFEAARQEGRQLTPAQAVALAQQECRLIGA